MQLTRPCAHQTLSIGHLQMKIHTVFSFYLQRIMLHSRELLRWSNYSIWINSHTVLSLDLQGLTLSSVWIYIVTLYSVGIYWGSHHLQSGSTEAHSVFSLDLQRFTLSSVWIYRKWYCPVSVSGSHLDLQKITLPSLWIYTQHVPDLESVMTQQPVLTFWLAHYLMCKTIYIKKYRITKWINRPGLPPQIGIFPSSFLRTSPHSVSPMFQQAFAEDSETRDAMTNSNIIIN